MRVKIVFLAIAILVGVFFVSSSVNAFGVNFHVTLASDVVHNSSSPLAMIARDNFDACLDGVMAPDFSVVYYYSNLKLYDGLHDWNTAEKLWLSADNDRKKAFAVCYKLHLAADSVAHNFYVPFQIRKWKLPNVIIHPVSELKIEGRYLNGNSRFVLSTYDGELSEWFNNVTGRDWDVEAGILRTAIGSDRFYQDAFSVPKSDFVFRLYSAIAKLVEPLVSDRTDIDSYAYARELSLQVLEGVTPPFDPAGRQALRSADSEVGVFKWGAGVIFLFALYWVLFRFLGKKSRRGRR